MKGFKDFIMRGNLVELAVAVAIGGAFTALVGAFTTTIIDPIIASAGGGGMSLGLGFQIISDNAKTFVNIGGFITAIITFLITAAVIYFAIVVPYEKAKAFMDRNKPAADEDAPATAEDLLTDIRDLLKSRA
ncbi:large conductance mechanosensitive channel protein MscL [Micrococcales bacterium 31B]|nr:large conductance mechanosensitive channel protein MscL [Micrococcales bacterium 31B]